MGSSTACRKASIAFTASPMMASVLLHRAQPSCVARTVSYTASTTAMVRRRFRANSPFPAMYSVEVCASEVRNRPEQGQTTCCSGGDSRTRTTTTTKVTPVRMEQVPPSLLSVVSFMGHLQSAITTSVVRWSGPASWCVAACHEARRASHLAGERPPSYEPVCPRRRENTTRNARSDARIHARILTGETCRHVRAAC